LIPIAKSFTTIDVSSEFPATGLQTAGSVAVGDKIYFTPRDATKVLVLDTTDDSWDVFGTLPADAQKWVGGVLVDNRYIYCTPRNETRILKVDTSDDTISFITDLPEGTNKWNGEMVGANGKVYMFPRNHYTVLEIDPSDDSYQLHSTFFAIDKWVGAVANAANTSAYGIPFSHPNVIKWTL
jgi:hypothetical protein